MNEDLKLGSIVWPNFSSPFNISCYAISQGCTTLAVGSYEGSIILFKIDDDERYISNLKEKGLGISTKNIENNNKYNKNNYKHVNTENIYTEIGNNKKNSKQLVNDYKNDIGSFSIDKVRDLNIDVGIDARDDFDYTNNSNIYLNDDYNNNLNKEENNLNNINLIPYCILLNNNNNKCNNTILQLNFGLSCCPLFECISREILISLHTDNTIYFWSLDEGRCFKVLKKLDFYIYNLRILPDRRFLLLSGEKKIVIMDLWSNKDKEIIACLMIDNYKNKVDDVSKTVPINNNSDHFLGDANDKCYSSSCDSSKIDSVSMRKEHTSVNEGGSTDEDINMMYESDKKKSRNNKNSEVNNSDNIKICSIATGLVPSLKEENKKSLIQCFKLLKRKLHNIHEKIDKSKSLSNHGFDKKKSNLNEFNEEYVKTKDSELHKNLYNLFYCPVLISASLNNGDIICWDLTNFLNFYKSKCRFVIKTEKTEIEAYNEIVYDISEKCIYGDLIKRKSVFSKDMNLKKNDKYIKYKHTDMQNTELYDIEPIFVSNLNQSQTILEIATNGNSSQIGIIDNYMIILQKTRLIIYEWKNSLSIFIPLMDLFCPDYEKSSLKKKKTSHWVGVQVLRRPLWKFSSGIFKSSGIKKKSFNIMQKLSKNICGSIIAWTNEGNFYCYTLPLKFSSLFLSFQSNTKYSFLTKISSNFLGSFKSPVPIIIHKKKLQKYKRKKQKSR